MAHSEIIDINTPLNPTMIGYGAEQLRNLKADLVQRLTLDHNMDGVIDTNLPTADGYHRKVTLTETVSDIPLLSSGSLFSSTNALTWTQVSAASYTRPIERITTLARSSSVWIKIDGMKIYNSTDGMTWTLINTASYNLNKVLYANSMFVVVGEHGTALTSTDGTTWTERTTGTTNIIYDVIYANSLFVLVCSGGVVLTSAAMTTFTTRTSNTTSSLRNIIFANSVFVAVGNSGVIITSSDATTWTLQTSGTTTNLIYVIFVDSTFYAVGYTNAVLYAKAGGVFFRNSAGIVRIA